MREQENQRERERLFEKVSRRERERSAEVEEGKKEEEEELLAGKHAVIKNDKIHK